MIVLPAIDIKDGICVRLTRGEFDAATKVAEDPVRTAMSFREAGATNLHIVDLDGALAGKPVNHGIIADIREVSSMAIEVGGGVRSMEDIEFYLKIGIDRVILGSVALKDPELVKLAAADYGEHIAVGIDAMDGLVKTEGWTEATETGFLELAADMAKAGVRTIIYTDIARDGVMEGPNLEELKAIVESTPAKIIASGGVRDIEDLHAIDEIGAWGAICGKSVYAGTLDLGRAVKEIEKRNA